MRFIRQVGFLRGTIIIILPSIIGLGCNLNNRTTDLPGLLEFIIYVDDEAFFNQIKEHAKQMARLQSADENKLIIEDLSGNEIIVKLE